MANKALGKAKEAKNDEFYTQFADIEKEMNAYLATPVGQKGIKLAPKFGFAGMQAVQEPEIAKKIEDILKKHIQIKE